MKKDTTFESVWKDVRRRCCCCSNLRKQVSKASRLATGAWCCCCIVVFCRLLIVISCKNKIVFVAGYVLEIGRESFGLFVLKLVFCRWISVPLVFCAGVVLIVLGLGFLGTEFPWLVEKADASVAEFWNWNTFDRLCLDRDENFWVWTIWIWTR